MADILKVTAPERWKEIENTYGVGTEGLLGLQGKSTTGSCEKGLTETVGRVQRAGKVAREVERL